MIFGKEKGFQDSLFNQKKEDINQRDAWLFLPALFIVFATTLLSIDLLWSINKRVGNTTTIIQSKGSTYKDAAIWLAINRRKDKIIVTGESKKSFALPLTIDSLEDLKPLKNYIEEIKYKVSRSTVLQRRAPKSASRVSLSVDRSLQYKHITPILHLIARSGFSKYSFEVRKIDDSQK